MYSTDISFLLRQQAHREDFLKHCFVLVSFFLTSNPREDLVTKFLQQSPTRNCVYLKHSPLEHTFIFYIHCLESSPKMGGHFWELITPSGGFWKKYWHNLSRKANIWTEAAAVQRLQGSDQFWPGSHGPGKALPAPCTEPEQTKSKNSRRDWVWKGLYLLVTCREFGGLSHCKGEQNPKSPHFHWQSTQLQKTQ